MKIKLLLLTIGVLTFSGCTDGKTKKQLSELKTELEKTKSELNNCSTELTELRNTAENRFIRAKKLLFDKKHNEAKAEFQGIVENFKGTNDAKIASREITKIVKHLEKLKLEAERKKALGFKILKPKSNVKYGDLTLNFTKIWTGKRWSFDDYGSTYMLRDAKRGNKHVLARVSISSANNNPSLPPVFVYQMNNGELIRLGTLTYEFRRWKDYGTYLGNNADYGNDFAHSKTIPFNLGLQLPNEELVGKSIFIVMKKTGCFNRVTKKYGNPEIEYAKGSCNGKHTLKVEDFESEYVLLKKL